MSFFLKKKLRWIQLSTRHKYDIIFHQDDRSHVSAETQQKLLQFDWGVLLHSKYSPDLSYWDYHFRFLYTSLNDENFSEACITYLEQLITQKVKEWNY